MVPAAYCNGVAVQVFRMVVQDKMVQVESFVFVKNWAGGWMGEKPF